MYEKIRSEVLECALSGYRQGLFAGTSGNMSLFSDGVMAITPSSLAYEGMELRDIVVMRPTGEVIEGLHKPSSEWRMHAAVYSSMPGVRGVVHTHSPYATALAARGEGLPCFLVETAAYFGGGVACVQFAMPGSAELGTTAVPALSESSACLLANHGALTVGESLQKAYTRAVYLEDAAKIYIIAGAVKPIDSDDLRDMKERFGW